MSQFISPENQKLLWNIIRKVNLFHATLSPEEQHGWFKQIVGSIYENKNIQLSMGLEDMNKQTIQLMLNNLKSRNSDISPFFGNGNPGSPQMAQQQQQQQQHKPNPFMEPATSVKIEPRSGSYSRDFMERQKEYENMMKKEKPEEPSSLTEKVEDTAIENMEELLQQHLKQRELDIMPFQSNQQQQSNEQSQKPVIHSGIKNSVELNVAQTQIPKVSWRFSEQEHHEFVELKQQIAFLKQQYTDFSQRIENLEKEIQVLRNANQTQNNIEMEVIENKEIETNTETI
jgi:hypothetical protein